MAAGPFRVGIVGCSGIGISPSAETLAVIRSPQPHSHAAAYHAIPETKVVAVCDIESAATDLYSEMWGAVAAYASYREMFERERLDLVSIVTPDHLHAEVFIAAGDAGISGIFCEKPIATTLTDADRMISAAERTGVKTVVNHTRRFDPFYRQAKRLIESGAIGSVGRVLGTLGGDRAMLFRNGTHLIDTMIFLVDSEPSWVMALLDDADAGYGARYRGDGGRDPSTDVGASGLIGFENGVRAFYNGSKSTATQLEIEIQADCGRLRIGNHTAELATSLPDGGFATQPFPLLMDLRAGMVAAVSELVDLVLRDGDGIAALKAARTTLSVLLGILASADRGGERVMLPLVRDEGRSASPD